MMPKLKDRIYDHEEMPPLGTWDRIASELDKDENVVYMNPQVRKKPIFARIAVAASILIILLAGVFYLTNKNEPAEQGQNPTNLSSTKVPADDGRYIIVTSPTGQKIKISSKFANYIGSLYQDSSENPDWYKKFMQWREIMQNKTLTPTTPNFLDVIEMSDFLQQAD